MRRTWSECAAAPKASEKDRSIQERAAECVWSVWVFTMSQECLSVKGWDNPIKTVIYTQKTIKKSSLDWLIAAGFSEHPSYPLEVVIFLKLAFSPFICEKGNFQLGNIKYKVGCLSLASVDVFFFFAVIESDISHFRLQTRCVLNASKNCRREFAEPKNRATFFSISIFISKNLPGVMQKGRKWSNCVENVVDCYLFIYQRVW